MMRRGSSKILVVIILGVILVPAAYAGLQFYSMDAADKSIINPKIDIGITDLLNIQSTLTDIILSRELDGEFDLLIEGNGIIPTQVKSFQAQVFLEGIYVGSFVNNKLFTIPASGSETAHMEFKIDLNEISLSDVELVVASIIEHNGEMQISLEALMEPVIIVFPITVPVTKTEHILTYSDAPDVSSLNWATSDCVIGDQASFSGTVTNVFRDSTVSGNLNIVVREDVSFDSDNTIEIFTIPIQLEPGESVTFSGEFTTYKTESTNGFFLRAEWGTSIIEEQSSSYPPRLEVIEGTLSIDEVYWTVSNARTTSCEVGDLVEAHILLSADNAPLDDDITVKIRKDIALIPDTNVESESYRIVLDGNQETEIVIEFSPSEASGLSTRGYFVEVEGDVDWTMNEGYPPRLTVSDSGPIQGSLSVIDSWWTRSSSTITSAETLDDLNGKIKVRAIGGPVSGQVTVDVRKDINMAFDETHASLAFSVSLNEGEETTLSVPFTASEASGSSFRGYFLDISGDVSWTMANSYPPRLTVEDPVIIPEPTGNPVVQSVTWVVNGMVITEASQGETVTVVTRIKSVDGSSEGIVTVHIRKDMALFSDEDLIVNSYEIDLGENESGDISISFTASDKSGFSFRGYFIQVDFVSWDDEWTMDSAYPPRLEVN